MSKTIGKATFPERHDWLDAVHRCSHLRPKTKNIAWALFSHADKESLWCYPNLDQLSADLGGPRSGKNVRVHITALERAGLLSVGQKMIQGHLSNNYTLINIHLDCQVDHAHHSREWPYEAETNPDPQPSALVPEPAALVPEPADHREQAITLSLTPPYNTVLDSVIKKPSASEIQEEIKKMGNLYFSGSPGSSDSKYWQIAASPRLANVGQEEDSFSEDLFTSKDASHPAHSGGTQEERIVESPSPLFSFKRRGFLSGSLASWWRRNALETQSAAHREDVHV